MTDPRIIPITPNGVQALKAADTERRVAIIERSPGGGGGIPGGALSDGSILTRHFDSRIRIFNVKDPQWGETTPGAGNGGALGNWDGTIAGATAAQNDALAIQDCIDAAAGNGIVYVPPGTYMIGSQNALSHSAGSPQKIVVPKNTTMVGVYGQSVLKLAPTNSTSSPAFQVIVSGSNVLNTGPELNVCLQDLVIDSNRADRTNGATVSAGHAVWFSGEGTATDITTSEAIGPETWRNRYVKLSGLIIRNAGVWGLAGHSCEDWLVDRCIIENPKTDGMTFISYPKRMTITNNVVKDAHDNYISVHNSNWPINDPILATHPSGVITRSEDITITGNVCKVTPGVSGSTGWGVGLWGVRNFTVADNVLDGCQGGGVMCTQAYNTPTENGTVTGNTIRNIGRENTATANDVNGIDIIAAWPNSQWDAGGFAYDTAPAAGWFRIVVSNNVVDSPKGRGLCVQVLQARDSAAVGGTAGVSGDATSRELTVMGNIFRWDNSLTYFYGVGGNLGHGILLEATGTAAADDMTDVLFANNIVYGARGTGFWAISSAVPEQIIDLALIGNRIYKSGMVWNPTPASSAYEGIKLQYCKGIRVQNNLSTDDRGNVALKTQTYGMVVENLTGNAHITNNDFTGNKTGTVVSTLGIAPTNASVQGNLGWSPWRNQITFAAAAWTAMPVVLGEAVYYRQQAVTFGFPCPTTQKVMTTPQGAAHPFYSIAHTVASTGATIRVYCPYNPGAVATVVNWEVEM